MLNLVQLNYFYLTAQSGSFVRASEQANITQPALSNAIKSLEDRLGFAVFERKDRPIRLTPRGRVFLDHVEKLLFEARNVEISARDLRDGEAGSIHIGMTSVFASSFGGEAAALWLKDHPKMSLDMLVRPTPVLVTKLLSEELDLIVGIASELSSAAPQLDLFELAPQLGRAYVRAGHPVLGQGALTRADLTQYGMAASYYAPSVLTQFAERFGFTSADDLPVAVNSENTDVLCDLTANGDFVLLSTRQCTRHATATGSLVEVPVELATEAQWMIATRRGRLQHPQAAALMALIKRVSDGGEAQPATPAQSPAPNAA